MATMLDLYIQKKESLLEKLEAGKASQSELVLIPELNYRIGILETCRSLCKFAPVTQDNNAMLYHYQLVDAHIRSMQSERRFGPKADENGLKKRETAAAALERVAEAYRRQFSSFAPSKDDQYQKCITKVINTVLPAWIQYRDAYVEIKTA